ncbi:hypothetical protein C8046_00790 [Serinibacter arcticus]|uniref:Uncharacterized protein n=1 Tax=Serinibacter arcticus TaxID=1655435 RepID=A0A2U1ZRD0_9MICO|nr:hypothetical protein [Serinibacter arcticus]PWD49472.1 hypothetical protein C8046_00790 [Serinibacter arcticus]
MDFNQAATSASAAIVRSAEAMKQAEEAEKLRVLEVEKRRREQAMRDAEALRRTPGTSGS